MEIIHLSCNNLGKIWGGLGMNNLSIFFILIFSFFHVFLFPYQPTPYNLFTGELDRKGEGDILSKIQMNQQKTNIFFEKGENGSDSKVFNVNNLSQFLNLSKNNLKPIIVKIFLKDDGNKFIYQGLADKFSKQALFISVNAITGEQFVKMFIFLLNVGGINLSLANDKYPIFLFCDSDFIIFQQNTIGFKKYGLTLLNTPFLVSSCPL